MPTMSADSDRTSLTIRMREKPSARSAAISPSRWFTETVSSTVMRSTANETVTVVSTVGILSSKVGEAGLLKTPDDFVVGRSPDLWAQGADGCGGAIGNHRWT